MATTHLHPVVMDPNQVMEPHHQAADPHQEVAVAMAVAAAVAAAVVEIQAETPTILMTAGLMPRNPKWED